MALNESNRLPHFDISDTSVCCKTCKPAVPLRSCWLALFQLDTDVIAISLVTDTNINALGFLCG